MQKYVQCKYLQSLVNSIYLSICFFMVITFTEASIRLVLINLPFLLLLQIMSLANLFPEHLSRFMLCLLLAISCCF